jgi:hypothetical protein
MRFRFVAVSMLLLFAAPAWSSDIYSFSINSTKYSSATTFSVSCSGLPSATCAAFGPSQITKGSEPGGGAVADTLALTSTADVAVFSTSTEVWTFDLFTNNIEGLGTYSFTGLSGLTEAGGSGGSGYVAVTGEVTVTGPSSMPEPGALWSLLLILIPTFLIGWRKAPTPNFKS